MTHPLVGRKVRLLMWEGFWCGWTVEKYTAGWPESVLQNTGAVGSVANVGRAEICQNEDGVPIYERPEVAVVFFAHGRDQQIDFSCQWPLEYILDEETFDVATKLSIDSEPKLLTDGRPKLSTTDLGLDQVIAAFNVFRKNITATCEAMLTQMKPVLEQLQKIIDAPDIKYANRPGYIEPTVLSDCCKKRLPESLCQAIVEGRASCSECGHHRDFCDSCHVEYRLTYRPGLPLARTCPDCGAVQPSSKTSETA